MRHSPALFFSPRTQVAARRLTLAAWATVALSGSTLPAAEPQVVVQAVTLARENAQPTSPARPPFRYAWGQAHRILPETTSEESGYFSLCEGRDGKIYVGTAKYGENAFLVQFDPQTQRQRIVLDTHRVCGLKATGYAAQAKLHTRNFVGPSGTIYVGSKQGYRRGNDTSEYPGGYLMTYDPATDRSENLGMPYAGEGVIDAVADEARGLIYVVSCEAQHWLLWDSETRRFRELGPLLTPYATTLIDAQGRAFVITKELELACYDPREQKVSRRPILLEGRRWTAPDRAPIPTWQLAADGHTVYLVLMSDSRLFSLDLAETTAQSVSLVPLATLVEGRNPDSRCALSLGPEGRVYAVVRVDNQTGFGQGYLHHLVRYNPRAQAAASRVELLGVLAVKNPAYFNFEPGPDGQRPPHSHGFHRLPDGTLTPLHHHMALLVARDGTCYVTILYPFTLLRIAPADLAAGRS